MELRINDYQVPESIEFNFDELKSEVAERVAFYKDLVYTDAQMKEAKADRARLRKVIDAIDAQRKKVKSDLLQPYTALETKLNEIKALIQEPIDMIDNQVKAYEELKRKTKEESIRQTFENKGYGWMADRIWNPKWLNATCSMKSITEEIDAHIYTFETNMKAIESLEEYSFEAAEAYKKTLDFGKTMIMVNDLKEQAKRKAEYEAEKERLRMKEQAEPTVDWKADSDPLAEPSQVTWPEETKRTWIKFEAYMSVEEALALRDFFLGNNIEFRKGE